jgi:DNA polymerase III epsilon subunit family exonuclease
MIDNHDLKTLILEYLDRKFIANFDINIYENDESLPNEIDEVDIPSAKPRVRRYKVEIIKKLIGSDIIPMPEYIEDNKKPKSSVIFAGFLNGIAKKTFKIKKGKKAGQDKAFYTFTLVEDDANKINCVYFASQTAEKIFDKLEEAFYVLCVGDLKYGLDNKLTYYINKISLATKCNEEIIEEQEMINHKKVVDIDILPRSDQENLFDVPPVYNDFIKNNNIVVFDIETTGLDPNTCEITEVGAVKVEHGVVTERFSSFAKPTSPIPQEVQDLTHITDEMVADAPKIEDVVLDFYDWCRGCVISGYNIINFDMKFINKVAENVGVKFDNEIVDTINVVRKSSLFLPNYKLGTVVKALDITLNDAHRAFNDAYATAKVLLKLNEIN